MSEQGDRLLCGTPASKGRSPCRHLCTHLEVAAASIKQLTGADVLVVPADIIKEQDCEDIIAKAVAKFGTIDILVNNSGTSSAHTFEPVTTERWQADLYLELFDSIHCAQYAVPYMKQSGRGSFVNLTAILAKTPPANSLPTTISRAA